MLHVHSYGSKSWMETKRGRWTVASCILPTGLFFREEKEVCAFLLWDITSWSILKYLAHQAPERCFTNGRILFTTSSSSSPFETHASLNSLLRKPSTGVGTYCSIRESVERSLLVFESREFLWARRVQFREHCMTVRMWAWVKSGSDVTPNEHCEPEQPLSTVGLTFLNCVVKEWLFQFHGTVQRTECFVSRILFTGFHSLSFCTQLYHQVTQLQFFCLYKSGLMNVGTDPC